MKACFYVSSTGPRIRVMYAAPSGLDGLDSQTVLQRALAVSLELRRTFFGCALPAFLVGV
jgi:hypothetical protein